jgi:hypothetical protein
MMRWLALFLVATLIWGQGEGRQIPDGHDKTHPGPRWCQNDNRGGWLHNCACKGMTDENGPGMCDGKEREPHGDPKCKLFCKRDSCACHSECDHPTE